MHDFPLLNVQTLLYKNAAHCTVSKYGFIEKELSQQSKMVIFL